MRKANVLADTTIKQINHIWNTSWLKTVYNDDDLWLNKSWSNSTLMQQSTPKFYDKLWHASQRKPAS